MTSTCPSPHVTTWAPRAAYGRPTFAEQVLEVSRQALMGEELTKKPGFVSGSKSNEEEEEEEEEVEKAMRQMCGLRLGMGRMMQIHSSPSNQNMYSSWGSAVDDDDEKENKK
ncbi:uncharacterized protein A4U43_C01F4120 [Asparagus officinalis]|uniref:Uncharacterized protein n=1 Tax=Asparagus officinalis TaxID=4686 RepID=A0A5P1FLW0_ASPOF|nr:uncharacterized protein A4U43_C01F4120 [Asparagus officinalis]